MNTNELMLGDWVAFRQDYPDRVSGISADGYSVNLVNDNWVLADDIRPIPLTQEILEKNGFKFDGSGTRCMMFLSEPRFADGIRFNLYVGLKNKTIETYAAHPVEKSPNWRKSNKVSLEVCGLYVHELQHALRLCRIKNEIVL